MFDDNTAHSVNLTGLMFDEPPVVVPPHGDVEGLQYQPTANQQPPSETNPVVPFSIRRFTTWKNREGFWNRLNGGRFEEFVSAVLASWKAAGAEPDVGLALPQWLRDLEFEMVARPIIDIGPPADQIWLWLRTFIQVGRRPLVDTGYLSRARAEAIWKAVEEREQTPGTLMITPAVMELTAIRR